LPLRDAQKEKADIIIINDPDADRIGVAVLHQGEYVRLTGNEVGALLVE
jgi:phosphomannomutase